MNWEQEIEIDTGGSEKVFAMLEDIQNALMEDLTREELEEFAGSLMKLIEHRPLFPFYE